MPIHYRDIADKYQYPADIIVYRDGNYAVAVKRGKGEICRLTNHAEVIQKAIDEVAAQGGKVFINSGNYLMYSKVKGYSQVKIVGAGRDVTKIIAVENIDIMFDFTEATFWGIENLTIDGNEKASKGIVTGGNNVRPRFLDIKNILIGRVLDTALDLGAEYPKRTDDTTIVDLYIEGYGVTKVGIDGAKTQVKFIGGSISGLTESAIKVRNGARLEFYGTVFSEAGATIIDIAADDYVEDLIFHGCWFEGAEGTKLIKRSVAPTKSKVVFSIVFEDCRIGVETNDFIDLTDIATKLYIIRGYTTPRTGYSPSMILDPDSRIIFIDHPDLYRYSWRGANNVEAYGYAITRNPNFHFNYFGNPVIPYETSGSGSITWYWDAIAMYTGTTSGSYARVGLFINPNKLDEKPSFDRIRILRVALKVFSDTAQIIHVVLGAVSDFTAAENTAKHVGFKIVDNVLYATVGNGDAESTIELGTISAGDVLKLEVVHFPGKEARFFVNGVDKGSITSNLPSGAEANVLNISVSNTEAADKPIYIYEIIAKQWWS